MTEKTERKIVQRSIVQHGEIPIARSSHTITAIGNALYLFGGEHDPRVPIDNDLWRFDLNDHCWTRVTVQQGEKPSSRLAHSAAAIGNRLFIYGGRSSVDMIDNTFDDFYSFDVDQASWTQHKRSSNDDVWPEKRSYHSMISYDNKLFMFAGCGEVGRYNTLWEYDTSTNKWTLMSAPDDEKLPGRGGCGLGFSNNAVWVFGGFCGHELGDVACFDLEKKLWHYFSGISISPRSVFAFGSFDGLLIGHGGEQNPSELGHAGAGEFADDIVLVEIDKNNFHQIETKRIEFNDSVASKRGWHAGTLVEHTFYVFGGNQTENERDNLLFAIELD